MTVGMTYKVIIVKSMNLSYLVVCD